MQRSLKGAAGAAVAVLAVLLTGAAGGTTSTGAIPESARPLGSVPTTVSGVADVDKVQKNDPAVPCAAVAGVRWYTVTASARGPMLARLVAHGDLEAALVLYRVVRSHRTPVLCAQTDRHGRARLAWYAHTDGSYLVGVARRAESAPGPYDLTVLAAERPEAPPGAVLPAGGVRTTIDPVLDRTDAWSVPMERGVTYRLNLTSPSTGTCIAYELYRPGTVSFNRANPVLTRDCGGYAVFTPGIDGGGDYSLLVRATPGEPLAHEYRLEVAAAGEDDTAPGTALDNGEFVSGSLFGRGVDTVDMYRFVVPRPNELTTIELGQRANVGFDLLVLGEMGERVAAEREGTGRQALRLHVDPGRYYAALRARGVGSGDYTLQIRIRDVTTTTLTIGGERTSEVAPATSVSFTVQVTSASHGGRVVVEIDHFDPLFGWHYDSTVDAEVGSTGLATIPWTPPSVGQWRARARYVGNPYSSFSESGYVQVHVAEPLE